MKKLICIAFIILTIGSLYFMSKGLVGIPLAYALITLHIARLFAEMIAIKLVTDKLTIREDIKAELPRKVIHMLVSLITIPMVYYSFKGTYHIIIFFIIAFIIIVTIDKIGFIKKVAARNGQGDDNIAGVYYMFTGFLINSIISLFIPMYNPCILLGAMALGLGDPFACIFGKLFGKYKLKNGKSVEGFIAFIVGSVIAMYIATGVALYQLIIIGFVGALIELYAGNRDNLLIQIGVGLISFVVLLFL